MWAMRVTARPFAPFVLANLPKQPWLKEIDTRAFNGTGQIRPLIFGRVAQVAGSHCATRVSSLLLLAAAERLTAEKEKA